MTQYDIEKDQQYSIMLITRSIHVTPVGPVLEYRGGGNYRD